jgi:hypothetical protein
MAADWHAAMHAPHPVHFSWSTHTLLSGIWSFIRAAGHLASSVTLAVSAYGKS